MSMSQIISIDHKKCVGCKACSNVCPIDLFSFHDENGIRTFKFGIYCSEKCNLCEKVCSGKAISLKPGTDKGEMQFYQFKFPMIQCSACKEEFATQKMAEKVNLSLSTELKDLKPDWTTLCLDCKLQRHAVQIVGTKAELHSS